VEPWDFSHPESIGFRGVIFFPEERKNEMKVICNDGTIRDENGYICVASSDLPFYSIVMTSVGPGKVYDTGCSSGTIDVYTNW
jgi:hypothetical protein